jgi:AcrR family transcriptional regulator
MRTGEPASTGRGLRAAGVQRNRRNIVAAGRQQLIGEGYHQLSLETVAAQAGVTRVTIYRHFGSKLGLLEAIAEDLAERSAIVEGAARALSVPKATAAFDALVEELCRFWATDPDLLRRLVSLHAVDPTAQHLIEQREDWRYQQVAAVVTRLAEQDRVRTPFTIQTATVVVGTATSFPACDEIARRTGTKLADLGPLLTAQLRGVIRLTR